jgi:hypothetical protein
VAAVKRSWFLPESPDVLGMLRRQAAVTGEGMAALVAWAGGEPGAAQRVRDCEHQADDAKWELRQALTVALTTPIDAENLYVMSERLDAVLNGAKDAVREAEVMAVGPDEAVAAMAALLADGVGHLATAFERLDPARRSKRGPGATDAADAAVKTSGSSSGSTARRHRRCSRSRTSGRSWAGGSCTGASPASARP